MVLGRVAENSRVRRSAGVASRMNSRSSRKPRSSISSASSSTTALSAETFSAPRSRWSRRRPGVPTTIWAPRASARRSRPRIHAADAGHDSRAGKMIEPCQLALDLQRQFARRRDDQGQRRRPPGRTSRRRPAASRPSPGHRRRSCPSRSGRKPAGRGPRHPAPARRACTGVGSLYSRSARARDKGGMGGGKTQRELGVADFRALLVLWPRKDRQNAISVVSFEVRCVLI